ncbi:MAG: restriction endonuclease, partial [Synergistaceae bacterium]|nr:restriction endonuclease [Synergistaceae bacterium]
DEPDTLTEESPVDEPDTLTEDLPLDEPDTLTEESPVDEPDTLTEELPADEPDTLTEDLPLDEPDTLTEESPVDEPDTLTEELPADDEPDMLTEELPAGDEADTLTEELPADVETDTLTEESPAVEPDTLTEESSDDEIPSPETEEDIPDIILDDEPEENLDTEEVQTDTMPEDLYSPDQEEAREDFSPDPEEEEESYDPSLIAAAMSSSTIDDAIARHNSELADSLLMKTAGLPSDRFEMLVIDLLSKMGYFAFQTARYTTESSGSDMIHGVILDNKTGANIYIQARKLSPGRTVGKADIQEFIDELSDKGGKGIYATTASFSENAKILANDERLMLIDGERLANLMIANNFCVSVEKVYEIKAIDSESFSEYE